MMDGMQATRPRWGTGGRVSKLRSAGAAFAGACVLALCAALAMPVAAGAVPPTGITGTVTEEGTSTPIEGVNVCALQSGTTVGCETTNAGGEYTIDLSEGEYEVSFAKAGFATRRYYEVKVTTGSLTTLNATLAEEGEGSISGTVTDASTGQPIIGIEACVDGYYEYYEGSGNCAETASNGTYTITGIHVGTYTVDFSPHEACEEEMEEKVRCEPSSNYLRFSSSSVRVRVGQTATVNAAMQVGGEISGTVTNAGIAHAVIAKIEVCASRVNAKGEVGPEKEGEEFEYGGGCAYTNASGQYAVSGLTTGSYKVEFEGSICTVVAKEKPWECPEVYIGQYYSGQQVFPKAGTIAVTLGAVTGGINESLREAFPTAPAATVAPVVTGTPAVGSSLSCSSGNWAHEPLFLTYQWLRDGAAIAGQAATTYTVSTADEGHSISCVVLVGNGAGMASATSNALAVGSPIATAGRVAKVKGNKALVKISCSGGASCSGSFTLVATEVVKRHHKRHRSKITLGSAKFSVAAGKTVTVRVHLAAKGLSALRKAGAKGLKAKLAGSGVKARTLVLRQAKKGGRHKKGKHHK